MGFIFHVIAVFAAAIHIFKLNTSHQEVLLEAFALLLKGTAWKRVTADFSKCET